MCLSTCQYGYIYQSDGHLAQYIQVPGQCSLIAPAPASIPDGLPGESQVCQHQAGMPAASPEQHAQQDTSLLCHHHGAGAQHPAGHVQSTRQPQVQFHTATADRFVTKAATGEISVTTGSRASLKQQQQQLQPQPDCVQQHSPSSRQSAVHSPIRRHHGAGSMPCSMSLSGCSTSPSSQQASNSTKGHSRHVSPSTKPAASLVTQCAQAGSSIKRGAKSGRRDSALGHPVPSQKLPDQSGALTPSTGRSLSESKFPHPKEWPGLSGWPARGKGDACADEGINSTTRSSSSSGTLDQQCLGSVLRMQQTASQSLMVPLELPSPMLDSSSEGTALPIQILCWEFRLRHRL